MTSPLTLSFGSDHGGLALRRGLIEALRAKGYAVLDRGTETEASCDYPDYAHAVGADVVAGRAKFGILVCTTGIGISIAANKMRDPPPLSRAPTPPPSAVVITTPTSSVSGPNTSTYRPPWRASRPFWPPNSKPAGIPAAWTRWSPPVDNPGGFAVATFPLTICPHTFPT
jgi:hypothetical protein